MDIEIDGHGARLIAGAMLVLGALHLGTPAQACSISPPAAFVVDPQAAASDTSGPGAPTVSVVSIKRGKGADTDYASCSKSVSSCDDLGTVTLRIQAQDDQTPREELGFKIDLVDGVAPAGLDLPSGPVRLFGENVYLHWGDGASDDQESFAFTLEIRALDLSGNVGPASTVRVEDAGTGGGCHVLARRPLSAWPVATILMLLAIRAARRLPYGRTHIAEIAPDGSVRSATARQGDGAAVTVVSLGRSPK